MSSPSHFVDVKQFGAAGDGVTDDTTAIQAAMSQLTNTTGMTLYFPPGTYMISQWVQVQLATDFEIRGYGAILRVKSGTPNNNALYENLRISGCQRWKLLDLTLDGNSANRGGADAIYLAFANGPQSRIEARHAVAYDYPGADGIGGFTAC
jgi:hypothetical protein